MMRESDTPLQPGYCVRFLEALDDGPTRKRVARELAPPAAINGGAGRVKRENPLRSPPERVLDKRFGLCVQSDAAIPVRAVKSEERP